jgi:hypothetical protein
MRRVSEQSSGLHNLARLTVAALRHLFRDPRALDRMIRMGCQALNRGDLLVSDRSQRCDARSDGVSIEMDGAGAAETATASKFRAAQLQVFADYPKEWRILINPRSVDTLPIELEYGHVPPCSWKPPTRATRAVTPINPIFRLS